MKSSLEAVRVPLPRPLRAAWGELHEREVLVLSLAAADRTVGRGEAAPLEPYDGVPLAAARAALEAYAEVLAEVSEDEHALEACARVDPLPQALAAVDCALWDMRARRAGVPVAVLLHPRPLPAVPVNATIGAEDPAEAAAQAAAAAARGFGCVKVKVGTGDDAGRLAAVRAAVGPRVLLRADANGAWATADEALERLRALAPVGLELCEEPVHGVQALRALRAASPVALAMDETAAPGSGATDAVCLKLSRSGGITGLLADARAARSAGSAVYVSSTFDGPLGIAAALHAAAALGADGPLLHCGLATLEDAFCARDGLIPVPAGPGLA